MLLQYLVITLGDAREATSVIDKTLNPKWNQTFDLPVSGISSLLLEAVCWDKDRFSKDYMGEFDVALEDIFTNGHTTQEASNALEYPASTWTSANTPHRPSGISSNLESRAARRVMPLARFS